MLFYQNGQYKTALEIKFSFQRSNRMDLLDKKQIVKDIFYFLFKLIY